MHNMFHLTRYQRDHTCRKRTCLLPVVSHVMLNFKSASCSNKNEVLVVRSGFTQKRCIPLGFARDRRISGNLEKWLKNRKADCFTLRKRITRLKRVNSEVRTVITHPKEGCLKWLHGTMSEPPWKSHYRQEWIIIWSGRNWILKHAD